MGERVFPYAESVVKDAFELIQPTRFMIYRNLKAHSASDLGSGMYAGQIAEELERDRKLISFHLAALEELGLVESDFKVTEPTNGTPKAARYYWLTDKADQVLKEFKKQLTPPKISP
jgi:DNA-binding transcriptional ArsR family regulator